MTRKFFGRFSRLVLLLGRSERWKTLNDLSIKRWKKKSITLIGKNVHSKVKTILDFITVPNMDSILLRHANFFFYQDYNQVLLLQEFFLNFQGLSTCYFHNYKGIYTLAITPHPLGRVGGLFFKNREECRGKNRGKGKKRKKRKK